nr:hypothetical protein [Ensifer canadensis]
MIAGRLADKWYLDDVEFRMKLTPSFYPHPSTVKSGQNSTPGWQRDGSPAPADTPSLKALRSLVTGLLERALQAEVRLEKLEAQSATLREDNAELRVESTRLKVENQLLRDEIARLKNLPLRAPFRPSGMDNATDGSPVIDRLRRRRRVAQSWM